jgi:SAM-dependent methyltransferase
LPDLLRVKDRIFKRIFTMGFHLFDLAAYEFLYRFSPVSKNLFFNGGYLPLDDDLLRFSEIDGEEPCAMMYHLICRPFLKNQAAVPKKILDVGCGQGGGPYYLSRLFNDSTVIGTERNASAVRLAQKTLQNTENANVLKATGNRLKFPDASFDAVLSVGAPTYFGLATFVTEAERITKSNGIISFSAGYRQGNHANIKSEIQAACGSRLELLQYTNITPNTFASLKADIPRRIELLKKVPWPFNLYGQKWADMPGSAEYHEYESGLRADFAVVLRKK